MKLGLTDEEIKAMLDARWEKTSEELQALPDDAEFHEPIDTRMEGVFMLIQQVVTANNRRLEEQLTELGLIPK